MSEWLERLDPRPKKIQAAEITRNERVLVAKCLREDFGGCEYAEDFRDRILDYIGGDDANGPANMHASLANGLADLIDPTCRLRFDSVHQDFVCTHCGAWFDGPQTYNGHGKWNHMRYCPSCGARVVKTGD